MDKSFDMFIETEVPRGELIISRTDLSGKITYVNETFAEISGYKPQELEGKSHNIIRHPDMPQSIFENLWQTLHKGESWEGYVKNIRKDMGYYWVFARVSPLMKGGKVIEYKSVREPISLEEKKEMQNLYDKKREQEEGVTRVVLYVETQKLDILETL